AGKDVGQARFGGNVEVAGQARTMKVAVDEQDIGLGIEGEYAGKVHGVDAFAVARFGAGDGDRSRTGGVLHDLRPYDAVLLGRLGVLSGEGQKRRLLFDSDLN